MHNQDNGDNQLGILLSCKSSEGQCYHVCSYLFTVHYASEHV